ncbi:hypothetical protein GQA12_27505 [Paenibacillus alvei]|nr:hypothetical protein [Paenibacillus alvei]
MLLIWNKAGGWRILLYLMNRTTKLKEKGTKKAHELMGLLCFVTLLDMVVSVLEALIIERDTIETAKSHMGKLTKALPGNNIETLLFP